jgi:hypothetical protein
MNCAKNNLIIDKRERVRSRAVGFIDWLDRTPEASEFAPTIATAQKAASCRQQKQRS